MTTPQFASLPVAQRRSRASLNLPYLLAPLAFVVLAACGPKDDNATVGQKVDSAIATTEQKVDEAKANAGTQMEQAKDAVTDAAKDVKSEAKQMANDVSSTLSDGAITTSVNAELAKDSKLSVLKINVDTRNGHVQLKGSAPDSASVDRATMLAAAVKGVVKVDNQLIVGGG